MEPGTDKDGLKQYRAVSEGIMKPSTDKDGLKQYRAVFEGIMKPSYGQRRSEAIQGGL